MRVLIIGGTGLISTAITRFLSARGADVLIYNRGQREAEIPETVTRIMGDRRDYAAFEAQMDALTPLDCVIDMVCYQPEEAESAVRAFGGQVDQYIFCSTVDVYTKPARHYPIRENAECCPARSFPYAFNKAQCESIILGAHQREAFTATVIRPAHTYGEGGGLIHSLGWRTYYLDRLRKGKPIIVHGDGTSLWSVCHRDDVGRAFVEAVGNPTSFGQAYHVTGEEWMTWDRYHQGVAEAMGAPSPTLVHIPTDLLGYIAPQLAEWCVENFQFNNIFDNTAARRDLEFRYTIPWIEGARRTVQWLETHHRIEDESQFPAYDRILTAWEKLTSDLAKELQGFK